MMFWWTRKRYEAMQSSLDRLMGLMVAVNHKLERQTMTLDELALQVTANTTVEASAIVLIQGLAAQIGSASTDPAKVQALADQLKASADSLAAAIMANTPPAPTLPPVADPSTYGKTAK